MAKPISDKDIEAMVRNCMKYLKMQISEPVQNPKLVQENKTLKPITGDYLRDMFKSKKFRELLSQAAKKNMETSHETGFIAIRDLESEVLLYSNVAEGGDLGQESAFSLNPELFKIPGYDLERNNNKDMYNVFDLHFHPTFESYVCPSFFPGDLSHYSVLRERSTVYSKPLCAVAQIDNKGNGEMILLQETWNKPCGRRVIKDIEDTIESYLTEHPSTDTLELANAFTETDHYKSAMVRFKVTNKTVKFNHEDLKELDIFAYQPKLE